ncbi:MAG: metalloregulator ArsR/SmtB family transcription factor [Pseudomonadota bacterium]
MDSFAALADPTRRALLATLAQGEQPFGALAGSFSISRPAVSQHLKILRRSGLVAVRRQAQQRIYRLAPDGLDEVDQWLTSVRSFWSARLDALERALQEDKV